MPSVAHVCAFIANERSVSTRSGTVSELSSRVLRREQDRARLARAHRPARSQLDDVPVDVADRAAADLATCGRYLGRRFATYGASAADHGHLSSHADLDQRRFGRTDSAGDLDRVDLGAAPSIARRIELSARPADIAPPPSVFVAWTTATPSRMPVRTSSSSVTPSSVAALCERANDPFLRRSADAGRGARAGSRAARPRTAARRVARDRAGTAAMCERARESTGVERDDAPQQLFDPLPRGERSELANLARAGPSIRADSARSASPRRSRTARLSARSQPHHSGKSRRRCVAATGNTCIRVDLARVLDELQRVDVEVAAARSTLVSTIAVAARKTCGYLSGLSSPSVTDITTTFARSPRSNSAGHTRLPTFSMNKSEPAPRGASCASPRSIIVASR